MSAEARPVATSRTFRILAVILIGLVVFGYVGSVVGGVIPNPLDGTHLLLLFVTIVICGIILRPQTLDRLTRVEGLGFKVELLQRLQERQVEQAEELQRLDLIIPLLFRDGERKHLSNSCAERRRGITVEARCETNYVDYGRSVCSGPCQTRMSATYTPKRYSISRNG
ncbi:MAG: hypothetical protein JWO56_747 [Acidobacteria bacterium]|nr:hypothetical protein [Acidobacteriota bacterium]